MSFCTRLIYGAGMEDYLEKKADQKILFDAYIKYQKLCKGKKMTAKQQSTLKKDLFYRADKMLLFFNSPATSANERNKLLRKCKPLYQQYCSFVKGNPKSNVADLNKKIIQLLEQMTIWEAEQIHNFRKKESAGDRLDIDAIFLEASNIRQLVSQQIDQLLKTALKDNRFTIVSRTDHKVFITEKGARYHRADCPFCRGRTLIPASFTKVENAGYTPCKCIGKNNKVLVDKETLSEGDKTVLEKQTMTAFIDESVRTNLWRQWDETLPERQSSYSYIICRGFLKQESEISEENTMSVNACLANEAKDVTMSAIEAISAVLLKIAFRFEFHGDVVIYTDNMAAKDKWHQNEKAVYLASLFESVRVCHIPREENTAADAAGREMAFASLPTALMGSVVDKCRKYDRLKEEMDFVKQYFPHPKQNIPNLIEELRLMAEEKGDKL